jgi:DNA-binding NtrC family response regulator
MKSILIFLVDDNTVCLTLYKNDLSKLGYDHVMEFKNADDLLGGLKLEPKIIFLDYNLGDSNGVELLKKIKSINLNTLVVFISGQDDLNTAVSALKFGAFDYIEKQNYSIKRLEEILEKLEFFHQNFEKKEKKRTLMAAISGVGVISIGVFLKRFTSK